MRLKPTDIAYRDLFRRYRILNIVSYFINEKHFRHGKIGKKSCNCAGCLKKIATNTGDLHLDTKSLFNSANEDSVVSSTLRFCPKRKCI